MKSHLVSFPCWFVQQCIVSKSFNVDQWEIYFQHTFVYAFNKKNVQRFFFGGYNWKTIFKRKPIELTFGIDELKRRNRVHICVKEKKEKRWYLHQKKEKKNG